MKKTVAALLCLIMLVCLLPLAAAEEAAFEPDPAFMDLFKLDYEINDPVYGAFYENKYVSDDGTIEKWYSSYLPTIDGLKRTDESRKCDLVLDEPCDIQEEHAHLYYCPQTYYFLPFYSDAETEFNGFFSFSITPMITQIDKSALRYLYEYHLYRLCDNIVFYQMDKKPLIKGTFDRSLFFRPQGYIAGKLVLEAVMQDASYLEYTNDMNDLLFHTQHNAIRHIDEWNETMKNLNVDLFYLDNEGTFWNKAGEKVM